MKRLVIALCLISLAAPVLRAQSLTSADREKAVKYLEKTRAGVLSATKGLSEAQWNFKPATNRWSVAEVTEHIAAAEDLLFNMVQGQVMKGPPHPAGDDVKAIDAFVLAAIPDRSHKAQAAEPLQPTNRFGSAQASLKHFEESRAKTIKFTRDTQDLREHTLASPPLGKTLDGYEWILFIAAHSERHTKQIDEVKADAEFSEEVAARFSGDRAKLLLCPRFTTKAAIQYFGES